jgi:hypothetical protein
VNVAADKRALSRIPDFPREAIVAAGLHLNFLELGSIGPDYPYLDILFVDSKQWADAMHGTHAASAIVAGAELVRAMPAGRVRNKCLAWLMGYTAHAVTDLCIHPVVELKVGPYAGNETAHRLCEMHQDAYIFRRIGGGIPRTADHLRATVLTCADQGDPDQLDSDVLQLWSDILLQVHARESRDDPPKVNIWYRRCRDIVQKLVPASSRFVGFARHACNDQGLPYPRQDGIDRAEYVDALLVPAAPGRERRMTYDEIFDRAVERVQLEWVNMTRYALGLTDHIRLQNAGWDLDSGRDRLAGNRLVFW